MKFNYNNCGITKEEVAKEGKKILNIISEMKRSAERNDYNDWFASINLPFDNTVLQNIKTLSQEYKGKVDYILVIGVGGSNLGAVAIYEAVLGKHYNQINQLNQMNRKRRPKILFADAADPEYISDIKNTLINALAIGENILINYISKSGTTIESAANFEIFVDILKNCKNYQKNYNDYVVVTTDEDSAAWRMAEKNKFKILKIPKKVGGRFSVFSAVGLFPLCVVGIGIDELLDGAMSMRDKCLNKDIFENPAALSAIITYLNYKAGKNVNVNFFFSNNFESIGKWLRQLIAESIGKEKNLKGELVNVGITPTVATAVDLHSMIQLYFAGPSDKFTNFIRIKNYENDIKIPNGEFAKKTLVEITNAISSGVQEAYVKRKIPFIDLVLKNKSEEHIGEFLQFKMMEIIFLAHLLKVNPFDQSNVTGYKIEARKILKGE